jgi:two-component sensor histidine kinase
VAALLVLCIAFAAQAASPKRVLLLHSFGRDFAPYDTFASVVRTEIAGRSTEPVIFLEANLDAARLQTAKEDQALVQYLSARFEGTAPDVVITIGPPAGHFYTRHRAALFPSTPLVMAALEQRLVPRTGLVPGDAVVAVNVDLLRLVENILRLLPDTEAIAVVSGSSEIERFWLTELERAVAPLKDRIRFEWFSDLSLNQMRQRVASLPPHTAMLYGLLIVDAAGVPHERLDALASLHAVANAPIFGIFEEELGKGVVGGPYASQRVSGERVAVAALRGLGGAASSMQPQIDVVPFEAPVYDWRELDRWNVDRARLPPGSEVRFKPTSIWEGHRATVLTATGAISLQAAMIVALMWQRIRRRRAESEARTLGGRLVTAHEDERRRLARELHDDVTQRLAGLAIEAASIESRTRGSANGDVAHAIREGLVELSEDVHALSYRLHPSVIEDLGLGEALQVECERVSRQGQLRVALDAGGAPKKLPADVALCLFRVAQEALRNVERHAHATSVEVSVARRGGGVALAVRDDGKGIDDTVDSPRGRLGVASMRERVRLLGGKFAIESERAKGTAILAWVPLREAA